MPLTNMAYAQQFQSGDWEITSSTGERFSFSDADWNIAIETPVSVWPAQPSTYLVTPREDDDGPLYWRTNILAWGICADGVLRPITTDPHDDNNSWTVLHPDGRVETSRGDGYENIDDWLAIHRTSQSAA
ncbi:hypothetical protein [Sphingomonas melonis]|uniref:Uncharacterized protein n=1 Tax=Sphingomonas melonis TaxID=152682 RepID=A0A7Y9FQS6_9SPHN|nr:hypothetical protein [Sphingomonas melonis]NYD91372.1 hypothetical protein [Sphingomonas melonis]